MTTWKRGGLALTAALVTGAVALTAVLCEAQAALRVCADPGNMPLSNSRGEGFENKIARVLARALDTGVENYYRPGVERGRTRTTLDADQCDLMLDMPADADDVLTTTPLYRSTYVLAYRSDRGLAIKSLDDPRLKTLRVGVYETSAIREALAEHDVRKVRIHYLSHDADLVPADQPSHQVQQVIDGELDVAAAWGPLAGYYRTVKQAPLVIQPVNLMDDYVPLEFDMAVAVRRNDRDLQRRLEQAIRQERDALRAILDEYGVPLVRCDTCIISGDLAAHGPYRKRPPQAPEHGGTSVSIAQLNDWLAHGASIAVELNNAVLAEDRARVLYLLEKKHAEVGALGEAGADTGRPIGEAAYTPLMLASANGSLGVARALIEKGADLNARNSGGVTALMIAAAKGHADVVELLVRAGADVEAQTEHGDTALSIARARGDQKVIKLLDEAPRGRSGA